ncbi:hypothetical protein [Streptomyces roseoverticillatus]|uniref:hypothetical protein n=1 Tax=Streptomyces roseoverticillatus TaxID=66429 RepID=UPI0035ABF0F5
MFDENTIFIAPFSKSSLCHSSRRASYTLTQISRVAHTIIALPDAPPRLGDADERLHRRPARLPVLDQVGGEVSDAGGRAVHRVHRGDGLLDPAALDVVEPATIAACGPAGLRQLYVALTRSTQSLTVLHNASLPEALTGFGDAQAPAVPDARPEG